jgi:hypothetical protein
MVAIQWALCAVLITGALSSRIIQNKTKAPPPPGDPDVHEDWDYSPFQDPDVVEKYTKAESVSELLFTMACKAKHKNDIDGKARDKAKEEKFTEEEFAGYVKTLQDKNLGKMKEACQVVNNKGNIGCRADCTSRWAAGGSFTLPIKKQKCLDLCKTKHTTWEKECNDKISELTDVYVAEQGNLANTKKCQQIHCKDFPQILVMKDAEFKDAEKEGCKEHCTDKQIKAKCVKRWALQADTARVAFQDECRKETKEGTLEPCKDDGTKEADDKKKKCTDDGKKKCDDDEKKCLDEGKAAGEDSMIGANADSICGVRKDVCTDQYKGKCKAGHEEDLKKVKKDCLGEHKEEQKKCLIDKMKGKKEDYLKKCQDDIKPTCKDDCADRCQVGDMRKCQKDMIAKAFGVTQKYCTQLWRWVFDSEQYDKKTMDPIPKAVGGGRFKLIKRQNE